MLKQTIIILIAVSISIPSYGRWSRSAARAEGNRRGNEMGSHISTSAQSGQTTQNSNYDSMNQSSLNNTSNSQKGQSTAFVMAAGLAVAAAGFLGVCGGSGSTAYKACIIGGILLSMAGASRRSGNSFEGPINDSWSNVCEYSTSGCSATAPNPYQGQIAGSAADDKINAARRAAASNGISVDARTGIVRTKDGKEIDPNNPASIEAAIGADGAGKLMGQVGDIEKRAVDQVNKMTPLNLADAYGMVGGGGGAMDGTAGAGYDDASDPTGAKLGLASARLRKPAQVSGLSKNFNGDPIGVASDSIFGMMSRRYQLKHTQKTFLGPEFQ